MYSFDVIAFSASILKEKTQFCCRPTGGIGSLCHRENMFIKFVTYSPGNINSKDLSEGRQQDNRSEISWGPFFLPGFCHELRFLA